MNKKYTLTQEGLNKLERELEGLQKDRPDAVAKLKHAREMGDLSENNAYTAAREKLNYIDHRIDEIKSILISSKVADIKSEKGVIGLGSTVEVKTNSSTIEYTIVSELESDITENKISDASPIGKALMGKKVNDKVNVNIPSGTIEYKITKVSS